VYPSGINVTLRPVKFTLAGQVRVPLQLRTWCTGGEDYRNNPTQFSHERQGMPFSSFVRAVFRPHRSRVHFHKAVSVSFCAGGALPPNEGPSRVCFARFCFVAPPDTAERNCGSYLRIRWREGLSEPGCPLELGTCKKGLYGGSLLKQSSGVPALNWWKWRKDSRYWLPNHSAALLSNWAGFPVSVILLRTPFVDLTSNTERGPRWNRKSRREMRRIFWNKKNIVEGKISKTKN